MARYTNIVWRRKKSFLDYIPNELAVRKSKIKQELGKIHDLKIMTKKGDEVHVYFAEIPNDTDLSGLTNNFIKMKDKTLIRICKRKTILWEYEYKIDPSIIVIIKDALII
jgi:hypothetical protein